MFKGVIKGNSRKILLDILKEKELKSAYVGCCGAFTIETLLLKNHPPKEIVSSDVSIFTNAIGFYLEDRDYDLSIGQDGYKFLDKYIDKGLEWKTAVVLYLQDLSDFVRKRNHHEERMFNNYIASHEEIIKKKVVRLEEQKQLYHNSQIKFTYHAEDILDFADRVPKGSVFIAFPPFYTGDYEKQYAFIEKTLISKDLRVDYKMFDDTSLTGMVQRLLDREIDFVIGTNKAQLFESWDKVHAVGYDYFSQTEMVTFITNWEMENKFAHIKSEFIANTYGIKIASKDQIQALNASTSVDIREIPLDLFDSIRRSRLSHKVKKYSSPMLKFGAFADDCLIGIFGIDISTVKGKGNFYYLLSDLPVENINNVAKLIAALPLSKSVQQFVRNKYIFDYDSVKTTVFTDKPASMKYRNFWKVLNRGEDERKQKFINYFAPIGVYSTQEIFNKWLKLNKGKEGDNEN